MFTFPCPGGDILGGADIWGEWAADEGCPELQREDGGDRPHVRRHAGQGVRDRQEQEEQPRVLRRQGRQHGPRRVRAAGEEHHEHLHAGHQVGVT